MESEAMTPPKRLVSSSISSSASATARSRQQAVDAAACEQHDQQEQGSEHDLPIFGHANRRIPEHRKRHRPDQDRSASSSDSNATAPMSGPNEDAMPPST